MAPCHRTIRSLIIPLALHSRHNRSVWRRLCAPTPSLPLVFSCLFFFFPPTFFLRQNGGGGLGPPLVDPLAEDGTGLTSRRVTCMKREREKNFHTWRFDGIMPRRRTLAACALACSYTKQVITSKTLARELSARGAPPGWGGRSHKLDGAHYSRRAARSHRVRAIRLYCGGKMTGSSVGRA